MTAAVANQILSTYVRATSVELQAREQLELVGRLEEVEEALDLRGKVRGA